MCNFQNFGCSNESSPNSSSHFWNHKVRVYSTFALLFSIMEDNSSVFFQLKPHILWTKIAHWSNIFGLLSGWVRIHQIPHVIFETSSQFFFKLFNVMINKSSVLFCTKVQSLRLLTAQVEFHQICTLIGSFCWKYIKFQLQKYRRVIYCDTEEWCNSFWRKTNVLFQKWQEFGEFWSKH